MYRCRERLNLLNRFIWLAEAFLKLLHFLGSHLESLPVLGLLLLWLDELLELLFQALTVFEVIVPFQFVQNLLLLFLIIKCLAVLGCDFGTTIIFGFLWLFVVLSLRVLEHGVVLLLVLLQAELLEVFV